MNDIAPVDFWIGVDLAQATFQAALAPVGLDTAGWQRLAQADFTNDPQGWHKLAAWIVQHQRQRKGRCRGIVVEATGGLSRRFAEQLAPLSLPPVSIINPGFAKALGQSLGQRSKNDKLDAAVLAVFGAVHCPAPAAPLTPAQQALRERDRLRQSLVEQQTAWQNSLREARDPFARKIIERQLRTVARDIEALDQRIQKIIDDDPDLRHQRKLLDSVPGIGPILAATLLAELGNLTHYDRDALVGYVGLFSRERRSGTRQRRGGGVVKGGGARVRRALGLAAMAIMRSQSPLKHYDLRLQAIGKSKMCALVALMRKLLLIARAVVKSGNPYDPAITLRTQPGQSPALP